MERRTFFKGVAASAAAAVAAVHLLPELARGESSRLGALAADIGAAEDEADLWRRVKTQFQLEPGLVHFNTGSVGACPRVVTEAVSEALVDVEKDPVHKAFGGSQTEPVRARAAEFIGADTDEVAITRNTTEGMNSVAMGLDLEPGDEVLTTNHEHGGGMICWQWLRKYRGIGVNYLKMPDPVQSKAQFLRVFEEHLTPRTKVCSFMAVDTITGMRYPLADMARITGPKGILLVCDGAHAPGMLDVDVHALGVDTFASSSHKWMLAPKGSGLLYIRKSAQERVHPVSFYSGFNVYTGSMGTRNVPGIIGHGVAMDFHNTLGRARVEARTRQLSDRLRARLVQIPKLELLTPDDPELRSGLVTFRVDGMSNGTIANQLYKEQRIVIKVAQGTYAYVEDVDVERQNYNCLRFSTHIYNDEADVDRLANLIDDILS